MEIKRDSIAKVVIEHQVQIGSNGEWITFFSQNRNVPLTPYVGELTILITDSQTDNSLPNRIVVTLNRETKGKK